MAPVRLGDNLHFMAHDGIGKIQNDGTSVDVYIEHMIKKKRKFIAGSYNSLYVDCTIKIVFGRSLIMRLRSITCTLIPEPYLYHLIDTFNSSH